MKYPGKNKDTMNSVPLGAKKKRSKKGIIALVIAGVVVVSGVIGLRQLRASNSKIYVYSVEDINNDWALYNQSMSATVSDGASQSIYLDVSDNVAQVFITEGQEVAQGDPLFAYDTEQLTLDVESRELDVTYQKQQLDTAKKQLTQYENIKVTTVQPTPVVPEVVIPEPTPYELTAAQKLPEAESGDGSEEDPYRYICNDETLVDADTWNSWRDEGAFVVLVIDEDEWDFRADRMPYLEDGTYMSVSSRSSWTPPEEEYEEPEIDYSDDISDEITYTADEKAKLIADQKQTIAQLENSIKLSELSVEQAKRKLTEATVTASMPGVIKSIGDPENPPSDGSAFCVVASKEGAGITGYISELDLDQYAVGDKFTVTSWMTSVSTEATIVSISDFPSTGGWVDGNQNASIYEFTAYMEDSSDFEMGEDVNVQPYEEDTSDFICIEKMYVRSDNEGNYVMKDEDGKLVKQYITVGRTFEGEYFEIKDGLTKEDKIAFPYGKTVKEGALTTDEYTFSLF